MVSLQVIVPAEQLGTLEKSVSATAEKRVAGSTHPLPIVLDLIGVFVRQAVLNTKNFAMGQL